MGAPNLLLVPGAVSPRYDPDYDCYSSTILLTSKITKQAIDNLFQFDLVKS